VTKKKTTITLFEQIVLSDVALSYELSSIVEFRPLLFDRKGGISCPYLSILDVIQYYERVEMANFRTALQEGPLKLES